MVHHQVHSYCYFQDNTRCKVVLLGYMNFVVSKWGEISRFVPIRLLNTEHCWRKETKMCEDLVSVFFKKIMTSTINFVNKKIIPKLSLHVLSTSEILARP